MGRRSLQCCIQVQIFAQFLFSVLDPLLSRSSQSSERNEAGKRKGYQFFLLIYSNKSTAQCTQQRKLTINVDTNLILALSSHSTSTASPKPTPCGLTKRASSHSCFLSKDRSRLLPTCGSDACLLTYFLIHSEIIRCAKVRQGNPSPLLVSELQFPYFK